MKPSPQPRKIVRLPDSLHHRLNCGPFIGNWVNFGDQKVGSKSVFASTQLAQPAKRSLAESSALFICG